MNVFDKSSLAQCKQLQTVWLQSKQVQQVRVKLEHSSRLTHLKNKQKLRIRETTAKKVLLIFFLNFNAFFVLTAQLLVGKVQWGRSGESIHPVMFSAKKNNLFGLADKLIRHLIKNFNHFEIFESRNDKLNHVLICFS